VVSEQALKSSLELIDGILAHREIAHRAGGSPRPARTDHGLGKKFVAALRHPPTGRRVPGGSRRPQEESGVRDPLAQPVRLLPAPRLRLSRRRFPHRAGAPHLLGGLTYGNQVQCEIDWWIFWGRVAGGLNRNQQTDVYQRLSGFLLPRGNKKPQRINAALLREMWRTVSSLELLPVGAKTELGDALLKRVKAGDFKESELWCLSRLGARKLFYGPINLVSRPPPSRAGWKRC
jgi:hypothetical protein